jgi:hypothetical protein
MRSARDVRGLTTEQMLALAMDVVEAPEYGADFVA